MWERIYPKVAVTNLLLSRNCFFCLKGSKQNDKSQVNALLLFWHVWYSETKSPPKVVITDLVFVECFRYITQALKRLGFMRFILKQHDKLFVFWTAAVNFNHIIQMTLKCFLEIVFTLHPNNKPENVEKSQYFFGLNFEYLLQRSMFVGCYGFKAGVSWHWSGVIAACLISFGFPLACLMTIRA